MNHEQDPSLGKEQTDLSPIAGRYLGFTPTDESPSAYGECEVLVSESQIKLRIATGLTISEDVFAAEELRPLSAEELDNLFNDGSDEDDASSPKPEFTGYQLDDGVQFIRITLPEERKILLINNWMADLLGPTILYGGAEEDVDKIHETNMKNFESEYGEPEDGKVWVPRLANGGVIPQN